MRARAAACAVALAAALSELSMLRLRRCQSPRPPESSAPRTAAGLLLTFATLLVIMPMSAQAQGNGQLEGYNADNAGIYSRTEAVRVKLVDTVNNTYTTVASCTDVTEAHLAALTGSLDLSSSSIDSLGAGDFSGLSNLTVLDLSRNQLEELPEGVFAGLVSLDHLDLAYNQLGVLPVGLFSGLSNLMALGLSRNQLEELPEDVFAGLASLKGLDLWFNQLRTLPAGIFSGLVSLDHLDLEMNKLHTLPAGVFCGLRLRFLGLEGNELPALPAGVFTNLDVTVTLDLSHNYLHTLSTGLFTGLANLDLLDLSFNELDKLPAGLLSGLTSLKHLWLHGNPGAPFVFTMIPKRISGTNKVVATVAYGAPFSMATTIGETGAAAVFPVSIPTGRTESDEIVIASLGAGSTFTLGAPPSVPRPLRGVKTAVCGLETFNENDVVLDQVTGVNVTEEVERLTVSWEVVCGASDYRIQWKSESEQYGSVRQQVVSGTAYTITDLNAGTVYTVRVTALRDHVANGVPSSEVSGTPNMLSRPPPPPPGTGGGGGGGPRQTVPDAPTNLVAEATDGAVTLTWEAPEDDGGSAVTDYQYGINGRGWTAIGSNDTTHTVAGLDNDTVYTFQVRAVNRIGRSQPSDPVEATPRMPVALDFTHFTNGDLITSDLVLVNAGAEPIRPTLYFYDQKGHLMDPETVVDVTEDLEITEDGALSVRTAMEPLGELTISTHGRGELVSGSVKAVSNGPMGGVLRFGLPDIGVAGVGSGQPVRDALFPARRQAGEISTAAAIRNLGEEAMEVSCRLIEAGTVLEEVAIHLAANGQEAQYIEEMFTGTDTSDFVGSVRCMAPPGKGMFTGVAVELDDGNRIITTLPVVPVPERVSQK